MCFHVSIGEAVEELDRRGYVKDAVNIFNP